MAALRKILPGCLLLSGLLVCPTLLHARSDGPLTDLNPPASASAPPHSAVLFSTRWERPEALATATAFGATHVTWLYPKTRDYLAALKAAGLQVGSTLNANQAVPDEGLARSLEGEALIAPWMQAWKARWISVSSQASRKALVDAAERHMAWGASEIQFDDPALATASFNWGGDFSDAAVQNFGRWLTGPGVGLFPDLPAETRSGSFDYRRWLQGQGRGLGSTPAYLARRTRLSLNPAWERFHLEEVRGFFNELRQRLHAASPAVALNLNLTNPRPDARSFNLIDLADGVMSETSAGDLANAALGAATVQGVGASYHPSLQPQDVAATRRQIAGFYALGALPLVPWDVYMPDLIGPDKQRTAQPRYFGRAEDYADLYRFVRANPDLFDRREGLASVLLICQVEHFKAAEVLDIVRALQARQIPFALMVARSAYPARTLDAQRIAQAPAVIFASAFSGLDAASQRALDAVAHTRITLADLDAARGRLAPLQVDGDGILALPRFDPARPQELIVHLLRSGDTRPGAVTLSLNPALLPFRQIRRVDLYSPARPAAQTVPVQGLAFSVPLEGEWATLRIQLQ
ncbi:hypothetical protein Q9Q94_12870 [Uliginosibacterium sp. 31-16]|uniref:hypothetical protein n=1 Tax=Uliginosibacterium sp. 31-16 TaxID=3068315 RepID=UPI00273FB6AB|nr:hypothetical protein [Uliginosibacterium sp. 31-16]MDP5240428.1 hypothetical protein [Uliginosibacterium sp. 31-16]